MLTESQQAARDRSNNSFAQLIAGERGRGHRNGVIPEPSRSDIYIPLVRTAIVPPGAHILGSMGCAPGPG